MTGRYNFYEPCSFEEPKSAAVGQYEPPARLCRVTSTRNETVYRSTKTFGHDLGLSAAFRQHKADSHCHFLHGYALAVRIEFEAEELDVRNWVVDFGSLKSLKGLLENTFDHKTLVAEDDPHLSEFQRLDKLGVIDLVTVHATGCEKFAELIFECTEIWLKDNGYSPRCRVSLVEVKEHGANSAIFTRNVSVSLTDSDERRP